MEDGKGQKGVLRLESKVSSREAGKPGKDVFHHVPLPAYEIGDAVERTRVQLI